LKLIQLSSPPFHKIENEPMLKIEDNFKSITNSKDEKLLFECLICHSILRSRCAFKGHFRLHSGERPYACELCDKKYPNNSSLTTHKVRIHFPEQMKWDCKYCKKKFFCQSHLAKHEAVHSGIKPYICGKCNECFAYEKSCQNHMKKCCL